MASKSKPPGFWRGKLERSDVSKIVDVPPKWVRRFGMGKMLIPNPLDVDALIRTVERGKLVTQSQLRERLAKDSRVDVTCPLTTGIFVRIAAEAAEEDLQRGKEEITPYWRVVRDDGGLNEKFPGGVMSQAQRLKEEGHIVEPGKGRKPPHVRDFERFLVEL